MSDQSGDDDTMTEQEYKDFLAEQDRQEREAMEELYEFLDMDERQEENK